jgi:acyl-CoA synthetase (NDP forming)
MPGIFEELNPIFYPRSVAFVGVSTSSVHWTRTFWDSAREFQFEGPLYAVNPHGGELNGCKVYKSIDEIPGNVDYAIGTVAARLAPEIVRKCAAKGVKAVHFCTAGFAEIGEKDVTALQAELVAAAHETGVRILGPNCMGIYCPESRLSFDIDFSRQSGNVGLISQSGGNALYVVKEANWRGVYFSKVVSFGNACDLNECDFLEYMLDDPQTKIIAMYLEGVRDGRRFRRLLERASREKSVVLVKGGCGEAGTRATASHTASLSGDANTWDALCRQFNIIKPVNIEELVDVLVTLTYMPDFSGRNVLLVGPGGGASVLLTDEFERRGFKLPAVTTEMHQKLLGFSQQAGNMLNNPIDYSQSMGEPGAMLKAIQVLTAWDKIDLCVGFFRPSQMTVGFMEMIHQVSADIGKAYQASLKPVVHIFECSVHPDRQNMIYKLIQNIAVHGQPLFYAFPAAAEALRLVAEYNRQKEVRKQA